MDIDIQKYEKCLFEIKKRIEVIKSHLSNKNTTKYLIIEVEFLCLQFRKVIELIAFSSMVANKNEYQKFRTSISVDFKNDWNAKNIFLALKKINPKFYPEPSKQIENRPIEGRQFVRLESIKKEYLTEKDAIKVYKICNGILHAWNPYSSEKNIDEVYSRFPEWTNKLVTLLNHHTIVLNNRNLLISVEMQSKINNGHPKVFVFGELTDAELIDLKGKKQIPS